jgi:motility quorum-sensing regulator/GCU-specific mRNA interferase toxin
LEGLFGGAVDDGPRCFDKYNQLGYISWMEKPIPHCKLSLVKALVTTGKVRATHSARLGATALGLELSDMLAVVMALTPTDFYKSMTTHADHTVWQDVYRPSTQAGDVYLKLTVIDDVLIVSFKEI